MKHKERLKPQEGGAAKAARKRRHWKKATKIIAASCDLLVIALAFAALAGGLLPMLASMSIGAIGVDFAAEARSATVLDLSLAAGTILFETGIAAYLFIKLCLAIRTFFDRLWVQAFYKLITGEGSER